MKRLPKSTFYTLVAIVILCFSFSTSENRIIWSAERDLIWSDFQGQPDYNDNFRDAVTASAIKFKARCNPKGNLDFEVSAEFLKNQSWVKPQAHSDYHLAHEQLHFDITEIYVRRIRILLNERSFTCDEEPLVQRYVQQIMKRCRDAQLKYDKETRFSLHKANQETWQSIVDDQLTELEQFSAKRTR